MLMMSKSKLFDTYSVDIYAGGWGVYLMKFALCLGHQKIDSFESFLEILIKSATLSLIKA